ncbi:MAG TPA: hypothetical protein VHC40_11645 [Rhizomicrobium sp.]|nr:hypothetical protein [Rhizomicrobium sp.]
MALTDSRTDRSNAAGNGNSPGPDSDPAPSATLLSSVPYDALARLPGLHAEAARDLCLAGLLARSPQACLILMVAWALALLTAGMPLRAGFLWSLAVLAGVAAITCNAIRGFGPRQAPLRQAVRILRAALFLAGGAWGVGALLVPMPPPAQALAFIAGPPLALTMALKDAPTALAFSVPALSAGVVAAVLGGWPMPVAAAIILAAAGIVLPALLHCAARRRSRPEWAAH